MNRTTPSVDEISIDIKEAIDNLSANEITREDVMLVIRNVVSDKQKRLKILDENTAKSRFFAKMGKARLRKFYPLLIEVEKHLKTPNIVG